MNDNHTNGRLAPQRVILVYPSQTKRENEFYLETRDIKRIKDKYVFSAAVPMSEKVIAELGQACLKSKFRNMHFAGLIPEHILFASNKEGQTVVVWYRKAMKRVLNLSGTVGFGTEINVHLPATLYVAANDKLYIFALDSDNRPTGDTRLYHAPFFNIYAKGDVCLGTARIGRVKAKTFEGEASRYEKAFYMAEQNGGGHNPCKTPLPQLWRRLKQKPQAFPKKELKPHKFKTLDILLKSITTLTVEDEN
jgi:PRTRC genetic system protein B